MSPSASLESVTVLAWMRSGPLADAFTPDGMPGREDVVAESSPWTPASGDVEQAKEYMAKAKNAKKKITIYTNEGAPNKEVAEALQSMWKQIGIDSSIKILEWQQFLEFLGPPPPKAVERICSA